MFSSSFRKKRVTKEERPISGCILYLMYKMVERDGLRCLSSEQISHNCEYYISDKCLSSIVQESQFREALLEISSLQFIKKLLYKELNNRTTRNTFDEWTKPTAMSQVVSTFKCNQNNSKISEALQSSQPLSVTNRFSVLTTEMKQLRPKVEQWTVPTTTTRGKRHRKDRV